MINIIRIDTPTATPTIALVLFVFGSKMVSETLLCYNSINKSSYTQKTPRVSTILLLSLNAFYYQ